MVQDISVKNDPVFGAATRPCVSNNHHKKVDRPQSILLHFVGNRQDTMSTQAVTFTIGQSGPHVFMEWTGALTAFPTPSTSFPYYPGFLSNSDETSVQSESVFKCKCRVDFIIMTSSVVFL